MDTSRWGWMPLLHRNATATSTKGSYMEKLDGPMILTNAVINWLVDGQNQKLSLDWQTRPIFNADALGALVATGRRICLVLQYQTVF
jgi:hypothetical protein